MKFGFRMPSLKRRIAARTSWKRIVRHSLGLKMPRGYGFLTNPKKALYNKVYRKTTFGIEDIFKGNKKVSAPSNNVPKSDIDQIKVEAKCPYCHTPLNKMPGAKTKCPSCGNYMYVRTRPSDKQRVVVTKQQADEIEEQWSIVSGTHDQYLEQKREYQDEKDRLKGKFGQEPSDHDVKWGLLNKELIEHAQNGDWGLYRNARLSMGDILRQEMKLQDALETYLEICYIDLNGPSNTGGIRDVALLKEYPSFDPTNNAIVAPGIIDYIQGVNKKLGLSAEAIKKTYLDHNQKVYTSLRLPVSPENSWSKMEEYFK